MVSCDFLDVVPAEKASDKDAFSSPKAAERFLYSCYGYIPQINMVQTCLDFSGDEIISPFTQESYVKFAEGVYTSGNLIISYWNDLFLGIRQCYLLKKNITSVPRIDQATIDSYVAQADFLIAYFHMLLIKCYGFLFAFAFHLLKTSLPNKLFSYYSTQNRFCRGVSHTFSRHKNGMRQARRRMHRDAPFSNA